jgi:hypothetical protein
LAGLVSVITFAFFIVSPRSRRNALRSLSDHVQIRLEPSLFLHLANITVSMLIMDDVVGGDILVLDTEVFIPARL